MSPEPIPLVDLKAQYRGIRPEIDEAISRVLESGRFIGGPEVEAFERELAEHEGAQYAVGVGSGTAALELALRAVDVGPDDEVIVPALTFTATAEAVVHVGATPVFCDVDDDGLLDRRQVFLALGRRTKAVIPVHLYGRPVPWLHLTTGGMVRDGLAIVHDAAQAIGATRLGGRLGLYGAATCYSFFPAKNLGAYGDGGAVLSNEWGVDHRVRMFADHGRTAKYDHKVAGWSHRLDALQAAILRVKLRHLDGWTARRRQIADYYVELLGATPGLTLPRYDDGHVWHLFVVRHEKRDALREHLAKHGIEAGVHYPTSLHLLPAYQHLGYARGDFPNAERWAETCLSLPIYPEMTDAQVERVSDVVRRFCIEQQA